MNQSVYRLTTAVSKTSEGYPIFVNDRDEQRFALTAEVTVPALIALAKEAHVASFNAWLEMQKATQEIKIGKYRVSDEHIRTLHPKKAKALQAALEEEDSTQLLRFLDDLRINDFDSVVSLTNVPVYSKPLVVNAIAVLAQELPGGLELIDALFSRHCVFSPRASHPLLSRFIHDSGSSGEKFFGQQLTSFAAYLTAKGLLLHPTRFERENTSRALELSRYPALGGMQANIWQWFCNTLANANGMKNERLRYASAVAWNLLRVSNVAEFEHLTPEVFMRLIQNFAPGADERGAGPTHLRNALKHLAHAYTVYLEQYIPSAKSGFDPNSVVTAIKVPRQAERLVEDFAGVLKRAPWLETWVALACQWLSRGKIRVSNTAVYGMNHFLDFLVQLDPPVLSPREFCRHHVVNDLDHEDPQTLWGFVHILSHKLKEDEKVGQATRNRVLSSAQELLEFFNDQEIIQGRQPYPVPITQKDRVNWGRSGGKSSRIALPIRIINRMKAVLLAVDAEGKPTFSWAKQERSDWIQVINRQTRQVETVFYPGRAILLYLMLAAPIRGFQARWLDSGERDERVYDFETDSMVENTSPFATKGRKDGVLRTTMVDFGETEALGLWINTNKTGFFEPGKVKGYAIPWCDDTLKGLLATMLDWHKAYYGLGASAEPPLITLYEGERRGLSDRVMKLMPDFVPLFRDPGSDRRRDFDLPISSYRLRCIFAQLLAEVEMQFQAEGERLSLVEWLKPRGDLKAGIIVSATYVAPKVDLHTLRVTGITALIDAGVPVHVVSEFVAGHATVIMTLYYHHHGPAKIREMLVNAFAVIGSDSVDIDGLTALVDTQPEDVSKFFLTQHEGVDGNEALICLKNNAGVATVSHSGICPGANCDEGGPNGPQGKPTAVPGGPGNCGQCRYWITGPAFLVGQIMEANTLMYRIRDKSEELKGIRESATQARLNKEGQGRLNLLAGRAERAEREITGLLTEWGARYRYIVMSNRLLDDWVSGRSKANVKHALVSQGSVSELRFTAKRAANLELLHMLGVQAELFPEMGATRGAIAELELTIAQVLAHNDMDGLLLTLSAHERLAACNLFAEVILHLTDRNENTLNNIISGSLKLSAFSEWQREAVALVEQLRMRAQPALVAFEGEVE